MALLPQSAGNVNPNALASSAPLDHETANLLKNARVYDKLYKNANDAVRKVILDCIDLERRNQGSPKWSEIPEEYQYALPILLYTYPPSVQQARQNFRWLLDRFEHRDITDKDGRTAWELTLTAIQEKTEQILTKHSPLQALECFLHLEMGEETFLLQCSRNGKPCQSDDVPFENISFDWLAVGRQNFLHVLYIMQCAMAFYKEETRHNFMRRIVRQFTQRQVSHNGIPLFVREPRLEVIDETNDAPGLPRLPLWALSMPYITTDKFVTLADRNTRALSQQWQYCLARRWHAGKDLHLELTLDEYCKPSLGKQLAARNSDQVLSKYELDEIGRRKSKHSSSGRVNKVVGTNVGKFELKNPDLLTVRQAWLWMVDNFVIVSLGDQRFGFPNPEAFAGWDVKLHSMKPTEAQTSAAEFYRLRMRIGLFLSDLINLPNEPQATGLSQKFFDTFESAIVGLSDRVSQYLRFPIQDLGTLGGGDRKAAEHFDFDDFDIMEEATFFHDIGDIREELAMILSVISRQEDLWKESMQTMLPDRWVDGRFVSPSKAAWQVQRAVPDTIGTPEGETEDDKVKARFKRTDFARMYHPVTGTDLADIWQVIERPQAQFEQYKRRIAQLNDSAARVESSIAAVVDLRSKHASMKEAHSTAIMSAAVFGFTLVTIVFTPLSFMLSLFALPIQNLEDHQVESRWNGSGVYQTGYVGRYMTAAELITVAITGLAMYVVVQMVLFAKGITDLKMWWKEKDLRRTTASDHDQTEAKTHTAFEGVTARTSGPGVGTDPNSATTTSAESNKTGGQISSQQSKKPLVPATAGGQPRSFPGFRSVLITPTSQITQPDATSRRVPHDLERQEG